jgi:hypothetical protein
MSTSLTLSWEVRNQLWKYDSNPWNAKADRNTRTEMALMLLRRLFSDAPFVPNIDFTVLGELVRDEDLVLYCHSGANKQLAVSAIYHSLFTPGLK